MLKQKLALVVIMAFWCGACGREDAGSGDTEQVDKPTDTDDLGDTEHGTEKETEGEENTDDSEVAENLEPKVEFTWPLSTSVSPDLGVEVIASDEDGTIAEVRLFIDEQLVRAELEKPYEWGLLNDENEDPSLLGLATGEHTLRAEALDDKGAGGVATLSVRVRETTMEISGNHVGGYQHAVTSGGFVPSEWGGGFSMYVAAWSLFKKYPGWHSQTGLFGTWMHTEEVTPPPAEKMYSDIEGGLGWWRNTRFATETPKIIMGGVAQNFSGIANGPGAGAGDWDNPRGRYGVAQLSPWILFPPDGLNLKQGASGELFGYGYLPLPLTDPKTVTAGKNVVTGNHCWTVFLNTKNFKGPAAFFLPYFFSKPSVDNPALSGMFLDSLLARPGGQISMETQHTPAAQSTTPEGSTYARVAPLLYPSEKDGTSILVHNLFYYDKTALWDKVASWFEGGSPATGYINSSDYFHREFSRHSAGWAIWEDPFSGGDNKEMVWDNYRTSIADDPHTNVVEWNRDLVKKVEIEGRSFNLLPEYLALDKQTNKWHAVSADEVPDITGLKDYVFPKPQREQEPYVTPEESFSVWKSPGPVAGPFYASPGDGSMVTYYWYRFADQPAMLMADMTDGERELVQKRVEKIHSNWTKERDYLAPPVIDKPLAEIDPALIVEPPAGFEVGYVPIVTRQEAAK